MNLMNTYSDEKFAYHVDLFKRAYSKLPYHALIDEETSFYAVNANQKTFYYEPKEIYAKKLEKMFPENQYGVVFKELSAAVDRWMIYIKNGIHEFCWTVSLRDEKRKLSVESMALGDSKKSDIPHVEESVTCFIDMMREMKEYRLYFLTGTVKEG